MSGPDRRQQGQRLAGGVRLGRADGSADALLGTDETDELRGDGVEYRAPDRDPTRRHDPATSEVHHVGATVAAIDDHGVGHRRSGPSVVAASTDASAATAAGTNRTTAAVVASTTGGVPKPCTTRSSSAGRSSSAVYPARSGPDGPAFGTASSASSRGRGSAIATRSRAVPSWTATRFTGAPAPVRARAGSRRAGHGGRRACGRRAWPGPVAAAGV